MNVKAAIQQELEPSRLIATLTAGAVVSVVVVIIAISLGTLIFGGRLSAHLSQGLALMLFSGVVVTLTTALFSSYPGMIASPQERVAPILAVMATAIVARLDGQVSVEVMFFTVVAAIIFTSLINGVFLAALGVFKLGALIRFIPYPVIGGFLGGTGWLLVTGSIGVMTGLHVDLGHLGELVEGQHTGQWIAGITFGLVMVFGTHHWKKSFVLPVILIGGIVLFYVGVAISGVSISDARDHGWLLGPFPTSDGWQPLTVAAFENARWDVVLAQGGHVGTILLISVISVLLNSGALELVVKRDIDLNRELKVSGSSNLLVGIGGGSVGFHSLSASRLAFQLGSQSRLVGVIAAMSCAIMLMLGADALTFLPRPLLGGLIFFLGMHFLIDWVYESWFRLTKADYTVVILILGVVAAFGYLQGVVVGTIACVVLFLVNYANVDVIKHALTGVHQHSNVDRPGPHHRYLHDHGERMHIFKLQGYIFFGTANRLLEQVRDRLAEKRKEPIDFMVLDFKNVTGIDSSSVLSFVKMLQLAEQHGFMLVFTHLADDVKRLLEKEGFDKADANHFRSFVDVDYGLQWCEDQILSSQGMDADAYEKLTLTEQLTEDIGQQLDLGRLLEYFERMEVEAGHVLVREGDAADDLFLIERGQVTAKLELDDSPGHRLRTMCAGATVGELGMILDEPRTATVVADRPSVVYRLARESWQKMQADDPDLAVAFFSFITHLIAERLANTSKAMRLVLD